MRYILQNNGIFTFVNNREILVLEKIEKGEKLTSRDKEIKINLIRRGVINGN
tara:strand:+ start:1304 stop:1459 length:156 start_codon:yes stop_codon:yes gene_type:complete